MQLIVPIFVQGTLMNILLIALAQQKKGKFLTFNATAVATLEEGVCFLVDGAELYSTIRHVNCEILLSSSTVC